MWTSAASKIIALTIRNIALTDSNPLKIIYYTSQARVIFKTY